MKVNVIHVEVELHSGELIDSYIYTNSTSWLSKMVESESERTYVILETEKGQREVVFKDVKNVKLLEGLN